MRHGHSHWLLKLLFSIFVFATLLRLHHIYNNLGLQPYSIPNHLSLINFNNLVVTITQTHKKKEKIKILKRVEN
jgi:hypothetical protein